MKRCDEEAQNKCSLVPMQKATETADNHAVPHFGQLLDHSSGDRGGTVVKVLRYKSEIGWFDPDGVIGIFH